MFTIINHNHNDGGQRLIPTFADANLLLDGSGIAVPCKSPLILGRAEEEIKYEFTSSGPINILNVTIRLAHSHFVGEHNEPQLPGL